MLFDKLPFIKALVGTYIGNLGISERFLGKNQAPSYE